MGPIGKIWDYDNTDLIDPTDEEYEYLPLAGRAFWGGYDSVDDYLMDNPDPREISREDYANAVGATMP